MQSNFKGPLKSVWIFKLSDITDNRRHIKWKIWLGLNNTSKIYWANIYSPLDNTTNTEPGKTPVPPWSCSVGHLESAADFYKKTLTLSFCLWAFPSPSIIWDRRLLHSWCLNTKAVRMLELVRGKHTISVRNVPLTLKLGLVYLSLTLGDLSQCKHSSFARLLFPQGNWIRSGGLSYFRRRSAFYPKTASSVHVFIRTTAG